MTITALEARPEAETLIALHAQGAELRVLAPPHAAYGPLLRAHQVAVEPWNPPRFWDVGRWRDMRRMLALFAPDLVLLRGGGVSLPLLYGLRRAQVAALVFIDRFEGDVVPGWLRGPILSAWVAGLVCDLVDADQVRLEASAPVTLIPPGHDVSWYPPGPVLGDWGIPERAFAVGALAVEPSDGQLSLLIDAARWLPMDLPIHFLLIAPPDEHGGLRNLIRRNPFPQRFHLVDDIGAAPELMGRCDVFVSRERASEPARRTLLHCLHHGVPCIVEDAPLIRQVVNPGVSGRVVEGWDPGALAQLLSELYEQPQTREALAAGARREAQARFSMTRVLQQTGALLESAAARA